MRIFFVFWLFFFYSTSYSSPEVITLSPGEVKTIELSSVAQIFLSRKGIVSLTRAQDDLWAIAGMRAGIVKLETALQEGGKREFIISVTPRAPHKQIDKNVVSSLTAKNSNDCQPGKTDEVLAIRAIIELVDDSIHQQEGIEDRSAISMLAGNIKTDFHLRVDPMQNVRRRRIIANPVIRSTVCNDIVIRAGGEDEVLSNTEDGRIVTAWKSHGLELKMKLIPFGEGKIRVPFSVSLRSPSKGHGTYGLTDIHSVVEMPLNEKVLGAVVDLSSSNTFEQNHQWIAKLPIIGPLFRWRDEAQANSKMYVWFEANQNSVATAVP